MLIAECDSTQDIATLLKSLFAGTIELEAEMAEHLGYSKTARKATFWEFAQWVWKKDKQK